MMSSIIWKNSYNKEIAKFTRAVNWWVRINYS